MPCCKRCGGEHFNFQPCGHKPPVKRQPDRFLRAREGARDFGNRFSSFTGRQHGDTIVSFIPRSAHPMYVKPDPPKEAA